MGPESTKENYLGTQARTGWARMLLIAAVVFLTDPVPTRAEPESSGAKPFFFIQMDNSFSIRAGYKSMAFGF